MAGLNVESERKIEAKEGSNAWDLRVPSAEMSKGMGVAGG